MSFSSLLSKVKNKKPESSPTAVTVDPAVARLKAARKKDEEDRRAKLEAQKQNSFEYYYQQNEKAKPAKTPARANVQKLSKSVSNSPRNQGKSSSSSRTHTPGRINAKSSPLQTSTKPKKKLGFQELMKLGSSIDRSKLAYNPIRIRPADEDSRSKSPTRSPTRVSVASGKSTGSKKVEKTLPEKQRFEKFRSEKARPKIRPAVKNPIPFAGPSEKLKSRQSKRQPQSEAESYESDFIVSDEEEEVQDLGYNRDEIWAMFNKGKKRRVYDDYDDDDDNMEATGAEIFEEEQRSGKSARLEDKMEEERLRKLEMEKKRRKMKM